MNSSTSNTQVYYFPPNFNVFVSFITCTKFKENSSLICYCEFTCIIFTFTGDSSQGSSQPQLDHMEKSDIFIHTKAAELIGRLSCSLWIYCKAFECVNQKRSFNIPLMITEEYVRHADDIVSTSYIHSETFSSVSITNYTFCVKFMFKV